ncbi:flippase-like domain-containing protein [Roseobacter sp. YSTF-M11]|uniref:Flippase-like domain-containing protein n=1 Tax=Roseobacter insulae TaxID=2859783 RepID=A0A9X1K301_9RHOB|nr:lysylphosphatidylglycerol synthase domain-containing protein [Roseobacter insulae]MBW4710804.1 flippase-like domain-containing protein [Roseobacter insulae]
MSRSSLPQGIRIAIYVAIWIVLGLFLYASLDRLPSRSEWAEVIARGGGPAVAAFGAAFFAAFVLRLLRFGVLTRRSVPVRWSGIIRAFPWLFMLGAVTPFRLGEGVRAHWVQRQGGSGVTAVGNWAAERWTDLILLVVFLSLGIAAVAVEGFGAAAVTLLMAGLIAGYLLVWFGRPRLMQVAGRLPVAREAAQRLIRSFDYMSDTRLHATIVLMTLAIWALMALGFWAALSLILDTPVPVALALGCVGAVNLIALVSAAPGNLVSFQAAMVAVMTAWGHSAVDALLASILIQSTGLTIAISLGLLSWGAQVLRARRSGPTP